MKQAIRLKMWLMLIIGCMAMTACDSDFDDPNKVVGNWYGVYTNSAWLMHLNLKFNADGTGIMTSEGISSHGNTSYLSYAFAYTVKGDDIKCKGTRIHIDVYGEEDIENDYDMNFKYSNGVITGYLDVEFKKQ